MSDHVHVEGGAPQGALDGAAWAAPGNVVKVAGEARWGRVALLWRCCGALEVKFSGSSDQPPTTETFTEDRLENAFADYPNNLWPGHYNVPQSY